MKFLFRSLGGQKAKRPGSWQGVNEAKARYLLQKMQKAGQLRKEGRYKDARYLLLGYQ